METPNLKTISYKREKKVNPALVNPRFEYMSETIQFTAWEDIKDDQDQDEIRKRLVNYVDSIIDEKTSNLILYYRNITKSQLINLLSVRIAFFDIAMQAGNDETTTENVWSELKNKILDLESKQTA